jgi:DNA topoisomerase-1
VAGPVTIDGEVPTKGMIALAPADPDALVVEGGDPAKALHVTLKFIGELEPWDDEARAFIEEALAAWASRLAPFEATVSKVGSLGDEGAMVLFLDAPGLAEARAELSDMVDQTAERIGADTTDTYPTFTAHLTVGYDVAPPDQMVGEVVVLDVVSAHWATDVHPFPLGAPITAAMKPKRDGDGDGFVDDGTPLERPVIPGFDLDEFGDVVKKAPKVPGGTPVPDDVAVKRGRVGNIDTPRLRARRERLIAEVDDDGHFYRGGRHGFAMRAAELTVIESELVKRGDLKVRDRYTVSLNDAPEVPGPALPADHAGDRVLDHSIDDWTEFFDGLTLAGGSIAVSVSTQNNRTRAYSFDPHTSVTLNLRRKSTGRPLGNLTFAVKDKLVDEKFGDVHFDHANLDPSIRGEGVGMEAFAHAVDTFSLLGFRQMTVDAQSGGAWGNPMANYHGGYTWARAGFDWESRATAQKIGRRLVRAANGEGHPRFGRVPEGAATLGHRLSRADFDADDFPTPNDVAMLGWVPDANSWFGKRFLSEPMGEPNNEFVWKGRMKLNDWPDRDNPFVPSETGNVTELGGAAPGRATVYHLTDKANFRLDPKKVPQDNALAINERTAPGLYVAKHKHGVEPWVNGYGYLRPFVVELDVPADVVGDQRWSGEGFIPADKFDDVKVKRVLPVDAFARETYNDFGWVESTLGSKFDDGSPVPEISMFHPVEQLPPNWRYEGPDVRDMTPDEVKRLKKGASVARKARESGKEAKANPFAATDPEGESGGATTGWDGRTVEVPERLREWNGRANEAPENWDREVPVLPDRLLEWAAGGANLGGLMHLDDERLHRQLTATVNTIVEGREDGLSDAELAEWHYNLWRSLTRGQDARKALSRALHDGPTPEEREFYGLLHQFFLDYSERRYPEWGGVVPVQRISTQDDPFTANSNWKMRGQNPERPSSGFTSWDAMDYDEPYGHELDPGSMFQASRWVGDLPKDQILGRFGDVEDEFIIARDKATLDRLLGVEANPFSTTEPDGESGYASSSKYPGMRPVIPDERKALRIEGRPIPPAWTDVHIATDPTAPMQVRGVDAKGRHQYIYSTAHTEQAAAAKFARVKELAGRMPELDAAIERDAMDDPAAAATALIRHFGLRPGSTSDTKAKKKAYGATTLQARHVRQYPDTGRTTLSFVGKSGVKITVSSRDPDIYRIVEHWLGDKQGMVDLFPASDADVRAYIDDNLGDGFKAKDLRTHLANVMALDMVSSMRRPTTQAKFKAARNKVADAVAKALGNTRAVTLSNYINPTVFAAWEGALPA